MRPSLVNLSLDLSLDLSLNLELSLAPPHTLPNFIVINFFARLWWNVKSRRHGFGRFGLHGHYNPPKPVHFAHWRFIIIENKWNLTGRKDSHVRLTCEIYIGNPTGWREFVFRFTCYTPFHDYMHMSMSNRYSNPVWASQADFQCKSHMWSSHEAAIQ